MKPSADSMVPPAGPTKPARVLSAAAVAALFLLVAAFTWTKVVDTDLFWHLSSGEWILAHHAVPRVEPFSYTAAGKPWVDIHWAYQVAVALIHRAFGIAGLTVARSLLILGLFALLYVRGRRGGCGRGAVTATLLLAAIVSQERFLMRPEIVSWLLMAACLAILDGVFAASAEDARARADRRMRLWVALPLLQLLWVNVQSLFILGPVLIALAIAAAAAEMLRRPDGATGPSTAPIGDLLGSLGLVLLACLANPYGAQAIRLPLEAFFSHLGGESLLSRSIAEFQPTLSGNLLTPPVLSFLLLAGLTIAALLRNLRRARLFDLLVTAAMLVVALRARRNLPLFAIAAVPILLRSAAAAPGRWRAWAAARWRPALGCALLAAAAGGLSVDVASDRYFQRWPTELWFGSGLIPHYFPEDAARFVVESGIKGQVFHSFSVGGYLMHAWGGRRPVFIDGRNDPYLDGVLESYIAAVASPEIFEQVARRAGVDAVLWPHFRAVEGRALLAYLARAPGWQLAHLDPAAAVFVRTESEATTAAGSRSAPAVAAPAMSAKNADDRDRDLARRLDERPFAGPPIRDIALAEFFSVIGDLNGAAYFYRRALDRMPDNAPLLHDYAVALERQGRPAEARAAHERAAAVDPGFLPSVGAVGAARVEAGKLDEGELLLERAYRGGVREPGVMIGRARLREKRGDLAAAVAVYQEALNAAPTDSVLLRDLARFYVRHDENEAALSVYDLAVAADPGDRAGASEHDALRQKLGR